MMRDERTSWCARLLAVVLSTAAVPALAGDGDARPPDAAAKAQALWKEGAGLHWERDFEAAISRYKEALSLQPSARTRTYLAWSLSELDRYEEAVAECRRALELDSDYPNAHNDLGSYLIELERPGEAIPHLRRAARTKDYCCPHFSYYQLGRAYLMQARVEEAEQALKRALSLRANYEPALRLLQGILSGRVKGL